MIFVIISTSARVEGISKHACKEDLRNRRNAGAGKVEEELRGGHRVYIQLRETGSPRLHNASRSRRRQRRADHTSPAHLQYPPRRGR